MNVATPLFMDEWKQQLCIELSHDMLTYIKKKKKKNLKEEEEDIESLKWRSCCLVPPPTEQHDSYTQLQNWYAEYF